MHLHDVFTPIEIADGLTSASRVEKLVSLMNQDKHCFAKRTGKATPCWSAVASILSATQNVDCLRQFTQLGGLNYLGSCLLEAQRCNINEGDSFVEEIIIQFLDALSKLPMKSEGYLASEVVNMIQQLHCHKNVEIQAKARGLSECGEKPSAKNVETEKSKKKICRDYEHSGCTSETSPVAEDENSNSEWTITSFKGVSISGDCTRETTSSCKLQPSSSTSSSGVVHFKDVKDTRECTTETTSSFKLQASSSTISSGVIHFKDMKDTRNSILPERIGEATLSRHTNVRSNSLKEITGIKTLMIAEAPRVSTEGSVSAIVDSVKSKARSEASKVFQYAGTKELGVKARQNIQENEVGDGIRSLMTVGLINKLSKTELSCSSSAQIMPPISHLDDSCQKAPLEFEICNNHMKAHDVTRLNGVKCGIEEHSLKDMVLDMEIDDSSGYLNKSMPEKQTGSTINNDAPVVLLKKEENMNRASPNAKTVTNCDTTNVLHAKSNLDISVDNSSISSKVGKLRQEPTNEKLNQEELLMESGYEPDNALEVAQKVGRGVELGADIYREASGSSSSMQDKNLEKVRFSVHSIKTRKRDHSNEAGQRSEVCTEQDVPDSNCSTKEQIGPEVSIGKKQLHADVRSLSQDIPIKMCEIDGAAHEQQSSQLTRRPEEAAVSHRACPCRFDLNNDFKTEEVEYPEKLVTAFPSSSHLINLLTPIPVMATCRGPTCLPTKPLHFEGELGWRGSAATSAFRPASLLKASAEQKSLNEGKNTNFRHLERTRGINLNIVDEGDDLIREFFPGRHFAMSSSLPSCDSSMEVTSRSAERLNLDLNHTGTSDDACPELSDWRMEHRHQLQGNVDKPSSASSLKTLVKDFDLNDNPPFDEDSEIHGPDRMVSDPFITVVRSKVHVGTKNSLSELQYGFGEVRGIGHSHCEKDHQLSTQATQVAAHSATSSAEQIGRMVAIQPVFAYLSPHAFSYSGYGVGPSVAMPSVCSSIMPRMDLQLHGATIKSQVYGPGTHFNFPRAPYLIDVVGETGVNEVGLSRLSLDLNAGFTSSDTETRAGNPRHLFPSNNSSMEDQVKSYHQVPISGSSMKRKEPECGWDPHQAGYRKVSSWR